MRIAISLLLSLISSLISTAQTDSFTIPHYPFLDTVINRQSRIFNFNAARKFVQDPTIHWSNKGIACYNYFSHGFALFLPDKDLKKIWKIGMNINPHHMCYSYLRTLEEMSKRWHLAKVYHHYLLQENEFFDSCCAPVVQNYNKKLINRYKEIDYYFHDNIKMGDVVPQQIRKDYKSEILKYLNQKKKYPGRSVVSWVWEGVACKILCLSDYATMKKYKPLVDEAVKAKDLKPQYLATLLDRMHYLKTGKQIYGTLYETAHDRKVLIPLKNEIHLNVKRKEMGLMPLEKFMKRNDVVK